MFCPKCGAQLPDGTQAAFCMACGTPLPKLPGQDGAGEAPRQEDLLELIERAQAGEAGNAALADAPAAPAAGTDAPGVPAPEAAPTETATPAPPNLPGAAAPAAQPAPPPDLFSEAGQGALFGTAPQSAPQGQPGLFADPSQGNLFGAPQPNLFDPTQQDALLGQPQQGQFAGAWPTGPMPMQGQPMQQPMQGQPMQQPMQGQPMQQPMQGQPMQGQPMQRQPMQQAAPRPEKQPKPERQPKPQKQAPAPQPQQPAAEGGRPTAAQIQQHLMAQPTGPMPAQQPAAPHPQQRRAVPPPPKPPLPAHEQAYEPPKRSGVKTLFTILGFFIAFLVVLAAVTLGMLMFLNRSSKTVGDFTTAVQAGDIEALEQMVADNKLVVHGIRPDEAQWTAFCRAFSDKAAADALRSQLQQLADGAELDPAQMAYGAVGVGSQPLFLFINHYYITISPVELLVPAAGTDTVLWLDDASYYPIPDAQGALYTGLMPGRYSGRFESTAAGGLNTAAEDIELFRADEPNRYEPAQIGYTLTISGCPSDNAVLYVNGQQVEAVPVGGVVTIPNVLPGALIEIVAQVDGIAMGSAVTFNDPSVTTLAFPEAAPVTSEPEPPPESSSSSEAPPATPTAPTAAETDALLATFYASYLECINQQSMAAIQGTTAAYNTELQARITSENNKPYNFQYVGAVSDPESVGSFDDGTRIRFNAAFTYNYRARDTEDEWVQFTNHQTVELVWQNGQWLVNGMSFVNENDFNSHIRVD